MENLKLSIETLSVEIRILSINQKKMTLSVFKQIREEPFFDREFNRLGNCFGYVNKDGYWIVWNKNDELRKTELRKIKTDRPTYIGALARRLSEINSKIIDKFPFKDSIISPKSDTYWKRIKEEELNSQLGIADSFVNKYNNFCDELLKENNQLFISI